MFVELGLQEKHLEHQTARMQQWSQQLRCKNWFGWTSWLINSYSYPNFSHISCLDYTMYTRFFKGFLFQARL